MKLTRVTFQQLRKLALMGASYSFVYGAVEMLVFGRRHVWTILGVSFLGYTVMRLALHVLLGRRFGGRWHLSWPLEVFEEHDRA